MEHLHFEVYPVGWPDISRYDIVALTSDGERNYLTYACCRYHAQVIMEFIHANIGNAAGTIAGIIRQKMNHDLVRRAAADCLINKALAGAD